jgi:hypothetical protein
MCRFNLPVILYFIFFTSSGLFGITPYIHLQLPVEAIQQDTLKENQILYNGRIWRNLYFMVEGDQFLFSKEFLPGSLTIKGKTFTNIYLKYDLLKDEVLTPVDPGGILQLNKEMVDSFSLFFQNKLYLFIRLQEDTMKSSKRYYNLLYKGKSALYLRYSKKIDKLAVDGKYDEFYQFIRIYFLKDNIFYLIKGKADLMKVLVEYKGQIKNFIKKNKLYVSEKDPESFIPLIRYYDTLRQ